MNVCLDSRVSLSYSSVFASPTSRFFRARALSAGRQTRYNPVTLFVHGCQFPMRRKNIAIETEILRAATTMFSERGYQATTLDDIAAAANISRATFYSYFSSKDELLRRIYRQVTSTTQEAVERIAAADLPVPEKLRRIIRYQVSYMAAQTSLVQVFFSERFNLPGTASRSVKQANRAFAQVIERVLEDGVRTEALRPLHPKRFTYHLLGMCNWMHRWYRQGGEWTPDVIAEEIIRILESGYLRRETEMSNERLVREVRALRQEVEQVRSALLALAPVASVQPEKNSARRQQSRPLRPR